MFSNDRGEIECNVKQRKVSRGYSATHVRLSRSGLMFRHRNKVEKKCAFGWEKQLRLHILIEIGSDSLDDCWIREGWVHKK